MGQGNKGRAYSHGGRSGIQEMKVWSPGLKQLRDRDSIMLQNILDLTDWRGLHMTGTPGSGQRSTEWAIEGRSQGSVFKVTSTVSIHNTPSWFTIQVRNRHRATETARELWEWLQSSLEGILVEEGLWKAGTGSSAPDTPRVFEVLGGPREESPARGAPSPCIHPFRDLVKGGKGNRRSGLKDLIRWISWGRFYLNADILSGGLLPENAGTPDEEMVLIESRNGELCVTVIESIEIGCSLLRGLGTPAEITLSGPNPIPTDFDLEDFLTRTLDTLPTIA
jgi:hypothetical protein